MNKAVARSIVLLLLLVSSLLLRPADAQPLESLKSQKELYQAIVSLDAALFDAYNECDLEKFKDFFADDLELYHDQDGVVTGKQRLTENIKKFVCGGDVRRELVPGSLRVHRMQGYGAVEIGVHRFHHPKSKAPAGERTFMNLWQYKDGRWRITRAISFDHHPAN
jgi:hypothetical protein